jgi:hypothetical protein
VSLVPKMSPDELQPEFPDSQYCGDGVVRPGLLLHGKETAVVSSTWAMRAKLHTLEA